MKKRVENLCGNAVVIVEKMYGIIKRSEVWKKNKLWMPERVPETFGRKKIWALDSDRGNRRKTKKRENVALPL